MSISTKTGVHITPEGSENQLPLEILRGGTDLTTVEWEDGFTAGYRQWLHQFYEKEEAEKKVEEFWKKLNDEMAVALGREAKNMEELTYSYLHCRVLVYGGSEQVTQDDASSSVLSFFPSLTFMYATRPILVICLLCGMDVMNGETVIKYWRQWQIQFYWCFLLSFVSHSPNTSRCFWLCGIDMSSKDI